LFLPKKQSIKRDIMKSEILNKLEELLETENILTVQKEFKQLSAQFKSLAAHGISDIDDSDEDHEDDDHEDEVNEGRADTPKSQDSPAKSSDSEKNSDASAGIDEIAQTAESESGNPASLDSISAQSDKTTDAETTAASADEKGQKSESNTENDVKIDSDSSDNQDSNSASIDDNRDAVLSDATTVDEKAQVAESKTEKHVKADSETPDPDDAEPKSQGIDEAMERFKNVVATFKEKTEKQRESRKKQEEETVKTSQHLIEELQTLVENEENIAKAFSGFNAIQEKWKSLPKVSNDAYRDLNAEYNKHAEKFFYNINIYKELKELDLKHNLEQKLIVLEDQKKLEDLNDIRRMEVEVRLNQDRWNEIGPTFKEEWDKIKDEFWSVTRNIYKKIQDFYNQRREQQNKNYDLKENLLSKMKHLTSLEIKSHKKWQEKTNEVKDIQSEWKMIGYVPKEKTGIWKEFRLVCDQFFDNKRTYYKEIREVQDANKDQKMNLLKKAEELKDSEDWAESSSALIKLQNEWKTIGPAHQRDENKMWRKFREACDQFFQKRKAQKSQDASEFEENLIAKNALLKDLEAFEPSTDRNESINALKEFAEKWRNIGHVPYKLKDKVNKGYKDLMDEKYGALKIDRKEKEKIRFEQKLEDIKDSDQNDYLIRKEQDNLRNKISKLKTESIQLENNMGFFANSKGAEKLKSEVEQKVNKVKEEITVLKERLKMLRNA